LRRNGASWTGRFLGQICGFSPWYSVLLLGVCSTVVVHTRVQMRHEHEYSMMMRVQPSCVSTRWHVAGSDVTILRLPWCRCQGTRWHLAVPGGMSETRC
jgi:hypothetical protein